MPELKACTGRTCTARIFFAITEKGKKMPFDAEPNDAGTFVMTDNRPEPPTAIWHTKAPEEGMSRFMPHHATCADVAQFRR